MVNPKILLQLVQVLIREKIENNGKGVLLRQYPFHGSRCTILWGLPIEQQINIAHQWLWISKLACSQCRYFLLSIKITKLITFVIFSLFLALIILRFPDFDKLATTSGLVICPPKVIGPWCSVLGTLDHSKKRSSEVTWPVTSPPVLLIHLHLSMERVIHLSNDNIYMIHSC